MARWKKGTYVDGLANYPFWCNDAQRCHWKFMQIRSYLYAGTIFAPMQGEYENETKVLVYLKNANHGLVQKGHQRGRAIKLALLVQLRTAPSMEICPNSG